MSTFFGTREYLQVDIRSARQWKSHIDHMILSLIIEEGSSLSSRVTDRLVVLCLG